MTAVTSDYGIVSVTHYNLDTASIPTATVINTIDALFGQPIT